MMFFGPPILLRNLNFDLLFAKLFTDKVKVDDSKAFIPYWQVGRVNQRLV